MGEFVGYLGVLTPLLIAAGGAVGALLKMYLDRNNPKETKGEESVTAVPGSEASPPILQGQPIVKEEWTWQDELKATRSRLDFIDACAEAFRDELLRQGIEPREVLIKAGLLKVEHHRANQGGG